MSTGLLYTPGPAANDACAPEPLMSGPADASTGVKSCPRASGGPPPSPKQRDKPCDVASLEIEVFVGPEGDSHSVPFAEYERLKTAAEAGTASEHDKRLAAEAAGRVAFRVGAVSRGQPVEPETPKHLLDKLNHYDLVLEVLAPETTQSHGTIGEQDRHATGRKKITGGAGRDFETGGFASFQAKAAWRPHCGAADHSHLLLGWTDAGHDSYEKRAGAGAPLKHTVYSRPLFNLHDPMATVRGLMSQSARQQEYRLDARSCGWTEQGTANRALNALVIAQPMDKWGFIIELNLPVLSFGWSAERSNGKLDHERAALQKKINQVQMPSKKGRAKTYRAAHAKAQAERKRLVAQKDRLERPPSAFLQELGRGFGGDEQDHFAELVFLLNDREVEICDIKKILKALNDIKATCKAGVDVFNNILTFLKEGAPTVVQPVFAFEISPPSLELMFTTRYRSNLSGARWMGVTRQYMFEGEGQLIGFSGTIGLQIGKQLAGTGLVAEASVTLEGKAWFETKVEFSTYKKPDGKDPGFWEEVGRLGKVQWEQHFKFKSEFGLIGRVEGRASVMYKAVGVVGAGVHAAVTLVDWKTSPYFGCKADCHPVVAVFYASNALSGGEEPETWTIMAGGTHELEFCKTS